MHAHCNEEWRPVAGFIGYDVSSCGGLRTWLKSGPDWNARLQRPRPRRQTVRGNYLAVTLHSPGKSKTMSVHVLVLMTFHGPRPQGMEASHLDGDPFNNHASNLAWESKRANAARKREHGSSLMGPRNPRATLTQEQADQIRTVYAAGRLTQRQVAAMFGSNQRTVGRIVNGQSYVRMPSPPSSPRVEHPPSGGVDFRELTLRALISLDSPEGSSVDLVSAWADISSGTARKYLEEMCCTGRVTKAVPACRRLGPVLYRPADEQTTRGSR